MSVNIKVTGGLNIEWGQIDPKASGGLSNSTPSSDRKIRVYLFYRSSSECDAIWLLECLSNYEA